MSSVENDVQKLKNIFVRKLKNIFVRKIENNSLIAYLIVVKRKVYRDVPLEGDGHRHEDGARD